MKVLFAVSNDKMSESIMRQYQKEYKQIISYKNVYYFNAILKELQRDKTYDRVVISEDLEQYVNSDYEQRDKFLFDKLDSISDEASNINGEDIPIILICTERRMKGEPLLIKLFGIGIYNAIIGNDRSVNEVCRLINRPRSKKDAKIYYKVDSEDVSYEKQDDSDVSELEIQNILAYYKRLGDDEDSYVEVFDNKISEQYSDKQLKVISRCLPLNVRAVLEERSPKYQQVNSYNNKISDKVRVAKQQQQPKKGTSEIFLKNSKKSTMSEPVVVPSAIGSNQTRKILTEEPTINEDVFEEVEENILSDIEIEELPQIDELPEIEDIPETVYMPEVETLPDIELNNDEEQDIAVDIIEETIEEPIEGPVKRKRGRPRKVVTEPVVETPKRKRGRPRKNVEPESIIEEPRVLPEVDFDEPQDAILPGFDNEEDEDSILPGFSNEEENSILPGFEIEENDDEDDTVLPGFEDNNVEDQYANVLRNLKQENDKEQEQIKPRKEVVQYPELNLESFMYPDQKLVAFVGTSKNGTSFLINNVAEILSTNGIDTAILDLTHNRNSYYIYTKNEENLREKSNHIMSNLISGDANGIQEHKNLTIYTSAFEGDEELQNVEPIIETLVKKHAVVLMDCDFTTPMRYFKYAQEIYLVQSMDILTIQPLTAFLRQLSDKNMFDPSKVRVVLNKFVRTKEINEELLVGGISIYNDAGMTVRKELFNRKTAQYITIPFDLKTYLSYLDGLVECNVSMKKYSKEMMQALRRLASMVYQFGNISKENKKYMPPSVKNNNTFSNSMNNTLNQMKKNY